MKVSEALDSVFGQFHEDIIKTEGDANKLPSEYQEMEQAVQNTTMTKKIASGLFLGALVGNTGAALSILIALAFKAGQVAGKEAEVDSNPVGSNVDPKSFVVAPPANNYVN